MFGATRRPAQCLFGSFDRVSSGIGLHAVAERSGYLGHPVPDRVEIQI